MRKTGLFASNFEKNGKVESLTFSNIKSEKKIDYRRIFNIDKLPYILVFDNRGLVLSTDDPSALRELFVRK